MLYIARQRVEGIVVQSLKPSLLRSHRHVHITRMDRLITVAVAATIMAYIVYMYDNLLRGEGPQEITILEVGIALLVYIASPSRQITHFVVDDGVKGIQTITSWQAIDRVEFANEVTIRRMKQITFRGFGYRVDGYIHDRDVLSLQNLLTAHHVRLRE